MNENAPRKQRSRCRIFADILQAIDERGETRITHLMHEANLPYDRLSNHLHQMEILNLVKKDELAPNVQYSITEKGRDYLIEFNKIKKFSAFFGVDI